MYHPVRTLARRAAAGLAISALALPTAASARPTADYTAGRSAPAAVQPNPDQRTSAPTSSLAGTTSKQDLRSPDAADIGRTERYAPAAPAYVQPRDLAAASEQSAATTTSNDARPIISAAAPAAHRGTSIEWASIALGIAGSVLAFGAIAALTNRRNRRQRALRPSH